MRDGDGQADLEAGEEQHGSDGREGKGATSCAGDEATAELESALAAVTVAAPGETSDGASKAEDETEEKLSFFLKNSFSHSSSG